MLTLLLSLGALVFATTESIPSCPQGDDAFLNSLLESGFTETDGTVADFLAKKTINVELSAVDGHLTMVLDFWRADNAYTCDISFKHSPASHQQASLSGFDEGLNDVGHHDCEAAAYATLEVIQNMLSGASKNLSVLSH